MNPGGVVAVSLLIAVVMAVAVSTLALRVRTHAQVSRRSPTGAPIRWLLVPTPAAILHRRLRNVVAMVQTAVPAPATRPRRRRPEPTRVQVMAADIEALAVAADRELIVAAHAPRAARVAELRRVGGLVSFVEDGVLRLVAVAAELDPARHTTQDWSEKMREFDLRLRAHEMALADLARFDVTIDTTGGESPSPGLHSAPSTR